MVVTHFFENLINGVHFLSCTKCMYAFRFRKKECHITLEVVGTFEFIFTNPRLEPYIVTHPEHQDLKKLPEPHVLF